MIFSHLSRSVKSAEACGEFSLQGIRTESDSLTIPAIVIPSQQKYLTLSYWFKANYNPEKFQEEPSSCRIRCS